MKKYLTRAMELIGRYLDDLLMLSGQALLTAAAAQYGGRPLAFACAGAALVIDAVIVARSRREG